MVDIGAVKPLTGSVFVKSQVADMEVRGFKAVWETLPTPQYMRGICNGSQNASRFVHFVGVLRDGGLIGYSSFVLGEGPEHPEIAAVPALYGLDQLSGMNGMFDCRRGRVICIPEGKSVDWPPGIRILQCDRAASGLWLLGVGHWDRVTDAEINRVRRIRASFS